MKEGTHTRKHQLTHAAPTFIIRSGPGVGRAATRPPPGLPLQDVDDGVEVFEDVEGEDAVSDGRRLYVRLQPSPHQTEILLQLLGSTYTEDR